MAVTRYRKVQLIEPIVLVDDDVAWVDETAELLRLEFAPTKVVYTVDPRRAMSLLNNERPSVLITDIRMPEVNGLELIMYAQMRWGNLPIIAMTSSPSTEIAAHSRFSGFAYLHKPVHFHALSELITSLIELPAEAFRGMVATTNLIEIVQLCAQSNQAGVLTVQVGAHCGQIWLAHGHAVHAAVDNLTGVNAFFKIMSWSSGSLSWEPRSPSEITLYQSLTELLVEAYLQIDRQAEYLYDSAGEAEPRRVKQSSDAEPSGEVMPSSEADPSEEGNLFGEAKSRSEWGDTIPGYPWHPNGRAESTVLDSLENWEDLAKSLAEPPGSSVGVCIDNKEGVWINSIPAGLYPADTTKEKEIDMALHSNNIKENLLRLESIEGFIGAAVADSDSGMCLGFVGGAGVLNMELAAASNAEVVRSKRKAMKALGLRDEIEDVLITLGKQYHLIRPLKARPTVFFYFALDRARANLAMARFALVDAERELTL